MTIYQSYCTLEEMIEDAEGVSLPVSILERFMLPAALYVSKEIGSFTPVIETRKLRGSGLAKLNIPALLRLTGSVVHYGVTLAATDYLLQGSEQSDMRPWPDGPCTVLLVAPLTSTIAAWCDIANSVELPAAWGFYERVDATGAVLTAQQLVAAGTVVVDDGSKLSPGMILQIDSEWQLVKDYGAPTASVTTLGAALDASSEIVTLASGAAVKVGEIIKIDFEKMKVLDIESNSAYVERGWLKTKKVAHLISAAVGVYRTFSVERGVNGSTAAQHESAVAVSWLAAPEDINYLTRQIATLMMKKSQTGYAGRSGSSETGETFYNFEFPRDAIERVKRNYSLV